MTWHITISIVFMMPGLLVGNIFNVVVYENTSTCFDHVDRIYTCILPSHSSEMCFQLYNDVCNMWLPFHMLAH